MNSKRHHELCQRGEQAEKFLTSGQPREALSVFEAIVTELEEKGDFDSFFAAKVTLGQLRCHIKLGSFKAAYQIWNASVEDSLNGIGIYALENAQTTLADMLSYDMICAFLHTLGENDKRTAAAAVNQYLSRVCEQAYEDGNRAIMKTAISNWKQHLRTLFGVTIPHRIAEPLIQYERSLGESVKPQPLDFPAGSGWERPSDFLEMSRFVEIRATGDGSNGKKKVS
jgi:hypothetical protein